MKEVLCIQDLSCVGKCSLTVALPVLSAMGCTCSVLPTGVMSTHTAFADPHIHSLTEDILPISAHWQQIGKRFDGILVGYLSDRAQMDAVAAVLAENRVITVLDPAMADGGKLYSGLSDDHPQHIKALCAKAQILLPNVTEACLLTGIPYQETGDKAYYESLIKRLFDLGVQSVMLTGISLTEDKTGFLYATRQSRAKVYQAKKIEGSFHGTGDIFSAVFTGGLLCGLQGYDAGVLAAKFVERVLKNTKTPTPFGVKFETQLPWLWEQLSH